MSTLGGIFSRLSRAHVLILMKPTAVTCYQVHMTPMTFLRSWVQRSRSQTTFSENSLFKQKHYHQFAVKDHLVLEFRVTHFNDNSLQIICHFWQYLQLLLTVVLKVQFAVLKLLSQFKFEFGCRESQRVVFGQILEITVWYNCCACAGLRPERPVICDDDCWQLMQRCWDGNANSRPHIGELEQALRSIHCQSSTLPQTFAAALQHDDFANLNGHSFAATSYQDTLSILQWLKFAEHYFAMLVC